MSQIENVITTTFRARGNQAISAMGQVAQGFGNVGRVINENTRLSERLNNQWRAIGTTIRYAVAGTAIFGLTNMVKQLAAMNQQLGTMQAISGIGSGRAFSNRDITGLFSSLQTVSADTITPLSQVNDAAINFLSTVQNVKPGELPRMLEQISQGAKLAQTPVEALTQAATTMQIAFGRASSPTSIGQFTRMWERLIGIAPGGVVSAPSIAQAMPSLASMFQLAPGKGVPANVGQAQLMTLTLGALRTGMPASTAMRGVTYLLQSLAQPTGKARGALAGIGITPQFVQEKGIYAAVTRLLTTIAPVSRTRAQQLGQIPDEALSEDSALPGIPASEMGRLRTMVPRIHGIRAAIILASQLQQRGNVESLNQDLQGMLNVQNEQSQEAKQLADAWANFRKRSRLSDAANQINVMALQVAQTFEPVFGFVAQHGVMPAGKFMRSHRELTRDVVLGGAGFMAAMGVARFAGAGNLPGLNRIPGLRGLLGGNAGRGFVLANAAQAAFSGNSALGASPQNPLYVVVVGEIFGGGTAAPGTRGGGGGGAVDNAVKTWLGLRAARAIAGRAGGAAIKGLRGGAGALELFGAEMPMLPDVWNAVAHGVDPTTGQKRNQAWYKNLLGMNSDFDTAQQFQNALKRAQRMYPGTTNIESFNKGKLHGRAEVYMTLDINQNGKVIRRKVHVPLDIWSHGRSPSIKANSGSKRSS